MKKIYLIGALRNRKIIRLTNEIEKLGFDCFSEWLCPGPDADSWLRRYYKARGKSYAEALDGSAVENIFQYDKRHIDAADIGILVAKAGKSAHLELGYMIGSGKIGIVYFENGEPSRWDIMMRFANKVVFSKKELFQELRKIKRIK